MRRRSVAPTDLSAIRSRLAEVERQRQAAKRATQVAYHAVPAVHSLAGLHQQRAKAAELAQAQAEQRVDQLLEMRDEASRPPHR